METYKNKPQKKIRFLKNSFEKDAWKNGSTVYGLDEVGRGCLAGPLVTAAVVLPVGKTSPLLKDSKLLTLNERQKAFLWISKHCFYAIGIVNPRIIQEENIWHATQTAMKKALLHLLALTKQTPSAILIDAMPLPLFDTAFSSIPVHHFIKGESKSSSIAAASIVAKVFRDNLMTKLDALFPGYQLAQHKGYATKAHRSRIKEIRHSLMHRPTFIRKILNEINAEQQLSFF